jgi:hypothetical protein
MSRESVAFFQKFPQAATCLVLHGTRHMSDHASKALAEPSLPEEPRTYDAISKRSGVPLTTLYYRNHGRRSKEEKAQGQQYLTPSEVRP